MATASRTTSKDDDSIGNVIRTRFGIDSGNDQKAGP